MNRGFLTLSLLLISAFVVSSFSLTGCAGIQKQPFTTASLEGKWVGEWAHKCSEACAGHIGDLEVTFKRLNATTLNIDIFVPKGIPGDRISINLTEESPTKLVGEGMGATLEIQLKEVGEDRVMQVKISHSQMGEFTSEGRCIANIIRGTYTAPVVKGKGRFTLEKKKK